MVREIGYGLISALVPGSEAARALTRISREGPTDTMYT